MDDTTKKMVLTIGAGILKKAGIAFGTTLATHGFISGNYVEAFGALAVALGSTGYSFWNDYGKAILLSQLDVLKAKSMAQAAKLHAAGETPVTATQIAEQSSTLTTADVTKVVATLPPQIQANVSAVAHVLIAIFVLSVFLTASPAFAQAKPKFVPTGDLGGDIKRAVNPPVDPNATAAPSGMALGGSGCKATGEPIADLHCVLQKGGAKLILHLKQSYALASAPGSAGGTVDNTSAMCTKALVPIVELVVNGPKAGTIPDDDPMALSADEKTMAADTNTLAGPIVVIEKIRILRLALQSPALNDACGALVQDEVKNAQSLVGKVTSLVTGAGIAGLPAAIGL